MDRLRATRRFLLMAVLAGCGASPTAATPVATRPATPSNPQGPAERRTGIEALVDCERDLSESTVARIVCRDAKLEWGPAKERDATVQATLEATLTEQLYWSHILERTYRVTPEELEKAPALSVETPQGILQLRVIDDDVAPAVVTAWLSAGGTMWASCRPETRTAGRELCTAALTSLATRGEPVLRPRFAGGRLDVPTGCLNSQLSSIQCGIGSGTPEHLVWQRGDPATAQRFREQISSAWAKQIAVGGATKRESTFSCRVGGGEVVQCQRLTITRKDGVVFQILTGERADPDGTTAAVCGSVGIEGQIPRVCAIVFSTP